MPDINGIPYVDSTDLVSGWPATSQSVAQEVSDQLALKQADVMTTKGDLAAYGTAVARLGVGSNGQVLTADSGETLGVKWADAGGGLTLIATESFSATSSVSVDGCFSASYQNYLVVAKVLHSASNTGLLLRLRASGSDATGSDYDNQRFYGASTSTIVLLDTSQTSYRTLAIGNAVSGLGNILLSDPFAASATYITSQGGRAGHVEINAGLHDVATSYDGLTLYVSSGTMTGSFRIYGYED